MPIFEVRFKSSSVRDEAAAWLRADSLDQARAFAKARLSLDGAVQEIDERHVPAHAAIADVPSTDDLIQQIAASPIIARPLWTIICGVILAAIISAIVGDLLRRL